MHEHFTKEGDFSVKLIPLGGNRVLLNFESRSIMDGFMSTDASWLQRWFYDIEPYSNVFAQDKRLTWFRLFGVPIHIWSPHFFKWFSDKLSSFVALDLSTHNKTHMDFTRIQVLVHNLDFFNKTYAVEVGSQRFHISVV